MQCEKPKKRIWYKKKKKKPLGVLIPSYLNSNITSFTVLTSFERSELGFLTSQFGFSQIIKEPTHILDNSRPCIDLIFTSQPNMVIADSIFTSQPNMVTASGVHTYLHSNCHHQIIYAKFDLTIIYPPPHERTGWHFR